MEFSFPPQPTATGNHVNYVWGVLFVLILFFAQLEMIAIGLEKLSDIKVQGDTCDSFKTSVLMISSLRDMRQS